MIGQEELEAYACILPVYITKHQAEHTLHLDQDQKNISNYFRPRFLLQKGVPEITHNF